jgi:hypothetical protein
MEPDFVSVVIVSVDIPPDGGDYHLAGGGPAVDTVGVPSFSGTPAPNHDIDGDNRPAGAGFDIGADELGSGPPPPPANEPPVAAFTFNCIGLTCDFDASASNDPDGTIVDYAWDLNGDNIVDFSGPSPSIIGYVYGTAGTYQVTLTVTDDYGGIGGPAIGLTNQPITVTDPATTTMHLGDLSGEPVIVGNRWDAVITVVVHNADEQEVDGATATVRFTWVKKNNGKQDFEDLTCVTDASGQCQVSKRFNPNNTEDTVEIEMLELTHVSLTYIFGDNDVGTTIFVSKP